MYGLYYFNPDSQKHKLIFCKKKKNETFGGIWKRKSEAPNFQAVFPLAWA